ncbi:MAG TPA: hypothetical protein VF024_12130 [Solirubrobacteraceae bacterium]
MPRQLIVQLVAETPEHSHTQNPGQPASTMKGYRIEAHDGEDIAAVMERVLASGELGPFSLGTVFYGYDEARAQRRVLRSQLATE